jgi:hypothetical protein
MKKDKELKKKTEAQLLEAQLLDKEVVIIATIPTDKVYTKYPLTRETDKFVDFNPKYPLTGDLDRFSCQDLDIEKENDEN